MNLIKNIKNHIKKNIKTYTLAGFIILTPTILKAQTPTQIRQAQEEFQKQPEVIRQAKVYDWFMNSHKQPARDSLEKKVLGNNALYHATVSSIQTKPKTGIGTIQIINEPSLDIYEKPFVNIALTGKSGYEWTNEQTQGRDLTTTFTNIGNTTKKTNLELQQEVALYINEQLGRKYANLNNVTVHRDENENIRNVDYTGPQKEKFVVLRKHENGQEYPHTIFLPGTEAKISLESILPTLGYNLNMTHDVANRLGVSTLIVDGTLPNDVNEALQARLNQTKETLNKLTEDYARLSSQKQAIQEENESLSQRVSNRLVGGAGAGITTPTNNISLESSKRTYFAEIGAILNNNKRITITGLYTPGQTNKETTEPKTNTEEIPLGQETGILTETTTITQTTSTSTIGGTINYGERFKTGIGLGVTDELYHEDKEKITRFEILTLDGTPRSESERIENHIETDATRKINPIISLSYNVGPIKIIGLYKHDKKNPELSVGAMYRLGRK